MSLLRLPASRAGVRRVAGVLFFSWVLASRAGPAPPWADFVEPDFPFISSVLDARRAAAFSLPNNLTPRGLILNLGHGVWACFDLDLLRVSAVWTGSAVTAKSMAQSSYQQWDRKSGFGEGPGVLPEPIGPVWLANGIYPGWQLGSEPTAADPRAPGPSPEEVGRGPLPLALGRFEAVRLTRVGPRLDYRVGLAAVQERMSVVAPAGRPVLIRRLEVAPSRQPLVLVLSRQPAPAPATVRAALAEAPGTSAARLVEREGWVYVAVAPHATPVTFAVGLASGGPPPKLELRPLPAGSDEPPAVRWPQTVTTRGELSAERAAYVVDRIALPLGNPWKRNVRPGDIQFLPDGSAAAVTLDGDVWRIQGLTGNLEAVRWKRFASGFNESLSLAIRGGEIFVFDRGGIWRLRDTAGRGEADVYELFSNVFAQSSDTREYASGIKLAPDGSFVIAKGGEVATYLAKQNGAVLRVAPNGRSATRLGWGFRQPFIGVNPRTGLVTASDQEGFYVPATPLYVVAGDEFHGFLTALQPREKYPAPIAEPLTWIPHTVSPSAITQVWLSEGGMGPLNGSLVMLSYSFPELFRVLLNDRESRPQAAVVSLTRDFHFAPLSAGVNPADGRLYVAGFKIFGTVSEQVSGLARVRYTGLPSVLPRELVPMDSGLLLRFDVELDPPAARDPARYRLECWNYHRSYRYGSAHYRRDGSVGQEPLRIAGALLSVDTKSVFLVVPGMSTGVMQMHLAWSLSARAGERVKNDAYFTPYALSPFLPEKEGFGQRPAPERPGDGPPAAAFPVSGPAEGARLAQALGCVACHSPDGTARLGPTWKGLFGQTATFADGTTQVADAAYIREHLRPHPNRIVRGYAPGMPSYNGIVSDVQTEALIAYIASLR